MVCFSPSGLRRYRESLTSHRRHDSHSFQCRRISGGSFRAARASPGSRPLALEHAGGARVGGRDCDASSYSRPGGGDSGRDLIDVTPTALQLGITFPVTITRPLWEMGIVTNQSLPEEDQTSRLRDILMAFRLRLASLTTVSPLLDFPVLLALPPGKCLSRCRCLPSFNRTPRTRQT